MLIASNTYGHKIARIGTNLIGDELVRFQASAGYKSVEYSFSKPKERLSRRRAIAGKASHKNNQTMGEEKHDSSNVGAWADGSDIEGGFDDDEYEIDLKPETAPPKSIRGTGNKMGPSAAQWDDALSACDDFDNISHAMSASVGMSLSVKFSRGGDDFSEISHDSKHVRESAEARQKALQKQQEFVRKETFAVRVSKLIVVIAIIGAGVTCALMTNKVVKEEEKKDFKTDVRCHR